MFSKGDKVYIIGIGGISLSAIALILQSKRIKVFGSDECEGDMVNALRDKGIEVVIGRSEKFVRQCDYVVYTSAVTSENKDIALAKELGKPIFSRAQILGMISKEHKTISVAGSHGKTTTTGMIASVFLCALKNPTIHIGGILKNISSNVRIGGETFITEACEYKDSFLQLENFASIILNIKSDHLDYFKNIENLKASFLKFAKNTSPNGVAILCSDDEGCCQIKKQLDCKVLTFGIKKDADFMAKNIKEWERGKYCFDLFHPSGQLKINLPCFGKHNVYNALATFAVCYFCQISPQDIKRGIENFQGVKRRFEVVSQRGETVIIHDYAHHPDEIKATISAGKLLKRRKTIAIFQPHTYSRTRDLEKEFLNCFDKADETWLLPIYPAREKPIKGVSSFALYKKLKSRGVKAKYFKTFESTAQAIKRFKEKDSLFLILGAGDIEKLAYNYFH